MNFGMLDPAEVSKIDFTLPADTAITLQTLSKAERKPLDIHVGGTQWGYKGWQGSVYPKKMDSSQYLIEYVKHFNCIEFGPTFYSMPKADQLLNWKKQAEGNPLFKFCPKFPQSITHIRRLTNAEAITNEFYNFVGSLGDNLGPLLLQLSEAFSPKSYANLDGFLSKLPKDNTVFVELRHKEWFANKEINQKVYNRLSELGIGASITDSPGRRDVVHMNLTIPEVYIRFVGNGLENDKKRLDNWMERISNWNELGLQKVWFMVHQFNESQTPIVIDYLSKEFNERLGLKIQRPRFATELDLFYQQK